jgi:hypothetical protein
VFLLLLLFRVLNLGSISIKINNPKTENQNSKTNPINHPGHTRKLNSNFIPIWPNNNPNPNKLRSRLSFDQNQSYEKIPEIILPQFQSILLSKDLNSSKKFNHHKIFLVLAMIKPTTKNQLQSPKIIPHTNPNHTPKFS